MFPASEMSQLLGRMRKYTTEDAAKQLTLHVFITYRSRLDNENFHLYGLPIFTIRHLQKTQNSAARLITHTY